MPDQDSKVIRKDIINLTCTFLETWFHQILYHRAIYPKSIFEQQRKFQIPVYIATHPDVQSYLRNFVQACYPLLEQGDVKFISVLITENDQPIEKFVFEINSYLKNEDIPMDLVLESESIFALADLEQHLRACLIKLNSLGVAVEKEERSFRLTIDKIFDGQPSSNETDWMPADVTYTWKNVKPLKSAPMDLFRFNTFIMESSKKGKERCP